jgi:hypothetical protein
MPGAGTGGGGGKKENSPLGQSLRNPFSVLKKGAGGPTKKKGDDEFGELPDGHDAIGTLQKGET